MIASPSQPVMATPQQQVTEAVLADLSVPETQTFWEVTQEEWQAIVEKMQQYASGPAGRIPQQEELYLTQQLTELFGFEVSAELNSLALPHTVGRVVAGQHLPSSSEDSLKLHAHVLEAGLATKRSQFGWLSAEEEQFYISPLLEYTPGWGGAATASLIQEWRQAHVLLINPFESRAAVCTVADVGTPDWQAAQFVASPEVIRGTKLWSPASGGRGLAFLIHDPAVKPGIIDWRL